MGFIPATIAEWTEARLERFILNVIARSGVGGNSETAAAPARESDSELAKGTYTGNNMSITAVSHATSQEIVTLPALNFNGETLIRVEFSVADVWSPASTSGHATNIALYELISGTPNFITILGRALTFDTDSAQQSVPMAGAFEFTPAAGLRTYSMRAYVSTGTGNIIGSQSGLAPPTFRITRV